MERVPAQGKRARPVANISPEDHEDIVTETSHIPDRDQSFHRGRIATPMERQEEETTGWSPDSDTLEEKVAGEEDEMTGVDQQFRDLGERVDLERGIEQVGNRRQSARPGAIVFAELPEFQNLLETRRHELEQVIVAKQKFVREQLTATEGGGPQVDFNHPADMVEGDLDFEREISLVTRERAELTQVNQALARIKDGSYGACVRCDEEISRERLRALPYATHCRICQESRANTRRFH